MEIWRFLMGSYFGCDSQLRAQSVASAAEELSSSISEIGRQVTQSAKIAGQAVDEAKRTDGVVQSLASGAQKIGEVVTLIQSIASQTNLLALNATIEAARDLSKQAEDLTAQVGEFLAAVKAA